MSNEIEILNEIVAFSDAIAYFKDKLPIKESKYYTIADEWKTKAFTISRISSLDMLNRFHDVLTKAIEVGSTIQEFRKEANSFLKDNGYKGFTPFQADNIFRTNIQTAYNVGHYKQMTDFDVLKKRPYWEYNAVMDSRCRPAHRALHGKIFPADHPFWDTFYPPNGYKCRCCVTSISARKVERDGLKVETDVPSIVEPPGMAAIPLRPDVGFDNNPAKKAWEPDLTKYPEELRKAYRNSLKGGE